MNKAFVRDPDVHDPICPQCGSLGEAVEWETIQAMVRTEVLAGAAPLTHSDPYYCPHGPCSVIYFDAMERRILRDALKQPAYPKDSSAPICPCFGLTLDDIQQDLTEGAPTRTRAAVKRAATDEADCLHRTLHGKSCVAEVQRYYLRHQQPQ
jgi:Zinc binding domain